MRWVPNAVIAFLRQAQDRQKRSAPNPVVWSKRMHIVIIANAPALDITPYRAAIDAADIVIAADGGALPLRDAERLPDLVIGDMDSLDPTTLETLVERGVELRRYPREK